METFSDLFDMYKNTLKELRARHPSYFYLHILCVGLGGSLVLAIFMYLLFF